MAKKSSPKKNKMVKIGKGMKVSRKKEREMEKRPGGSNVGEYPNVKKGDFAGPAGGAPPGSYPIPNLAKAKSALKLAGHAPNPAGIKRAVYKKYPQLKPKSVKGKNGSKKKK